MGRLDEKAHETRDILVKGILFFAVLGCIVLIVAVNMISKAFMDFIPHDEPAQSQPAQAPH